LTTVSIIIPVFNEENTIVEILEKVAAQKLDGISFEVIIVDDGSSDQSLALIKSHPELYSKLVEQSVNCGKGAAVIGGLKVASGDYILFQDADLEYDPEDYRKLLEPVTRFDADIVMGSRLVASPITRVSYFWHRAGNRLITLLFNILNNTTFTDVYSCYLLYRRTLVAPYELKVLGWGQHAEILSIAAGRAAKMYEVPVNYYGRSYDEGKKIRAHHTLSVIWTMLTKRFTRTAQPRDNTQN
jgi:glycosyltransferase involved in cell wall biosynthesis